MVSALCGNFIFQFACKFEGIFSFQLVELLGCMSDLSEMMPAKILNWSSIQKIII
jgi:hypothetical protein